VVDLVYDVKVREKDTVKVPFVLRDEDALAIPLANLTTITVTLTEKQENATVNGRTTTSIKNVNGGFIHATDGSGFWLMDPADNTIVNAGTDFGQLELHVLLVEFLYQATKKGSASFVIAVERIRNRS
jgi:hypothetical protein